ncbi:proton myo-inositol cotransporter [Plectosphaerella plurivora]|uniref:Proton myo-inositol cotransporter n=1 Tax=Plectosphaerella plurivora TaxID=936078 RepID=A0A9P8VDV2_9PEZI|nr:proton myo-inositol cotransporter [Plectosphaerella plurivora]
MSAIMDPQNEFSRIATSPKSEANAEMDRLKTSRKLANPLQGFTPQDLREQAAAFCLSNGIDDDEDVRAFEIGAILAGDPSSYEKLPDLTEDERSSLDQELNDRWRSLPGMAWFVVVVCSLCAAVQGMDETTLNGAQIFFQKQFGINGITLGIVNASPYACCAFLSCWLTGPLNKTFGRRGTIFVCCFISFAACILQACATSWKWLLGARILLGLGIGPKSATTPIYAAECAPPALRGALTMQWQMWTAFGIMVGFAMDLAFLPMANENLKWRFMIGSTAVPALIVCLLCFFCPESPRHYLARKDPRRAYVAMGKLRKTRVQAARDIFSADAMLQAENVARAMRKKGFFATFGDFFTVRRLRNAMCASEIVMIMQQFCGVNVIAYYSSHFLVDEGVSQNIAFAVSMGWGMCNWLGAIPALFTIDRIGRRNLLLGTFPLMSIFLIFTGLSCQYLDGTAKLVGIALGTYLFVLVYSPGAGPVPFTYSAEAYPLYVRPVGMSLATATTWLFNCILALTFPKLKEAIHGVGAFSLYGGLNLVGFVLTLFFVPETKGFSLEELEGVFSVPMKTFMKYGALQVRYFFGHHIFRRDMEKPKAPFNHHVVPEEAEPRDGYQSGEA